MVAEYLGVANIATQRVHTLVPTNSIILKIDAPRAAAEVRKPDRRDWPLNSAALKPVRARIVFYDLGNGSSTESSA